MKKKDLEQYLVRSLEGGATGAKAIQPSSVVTAPWVRMKCQFGCSGYDFSYCCPPHTPTDEETRKILDSYHRAILFHIETSLTPDRTGLLKRYRNTLLDLEREMFKDGYYKAFIFLSGPCRLCKACGKVAGTACQHGERARPSMEGCGIDVFQTARNNGFSIETLRTPEEPRNNFCLMLVD
jgi:predicted metal-binding protein